MILHFAGSIITILKWAPRLSTRDPLLLVYTRATAEARKEVVALVTMMHHRGCCCGCGAGDPQEKVMYKK